MIPALDPNQPRDPNLARILRSYAMGAVDANLKQMLLRIAAEHDAETARLQSPIVTANGGAKGQ